MLELTELQKKGLEEIIARFKAKKRYAVLSGYAGSGKSTLVKFVVQALGFNEEKSKVAFATPTGKAASVLAQMGHQNASTIHRLLYEWRPRSDGGFYRYKIEELPPLVICDEVSMISSDMIKDLLSHKETFVVFCGDPGQLSPINTNDDNHLLDNPHVFLNEVHRQALDSDIIKLTMDIRNDKTINHFVGKDAQILSKNELSHGMLTWADQIICATNATRMAINKEVKQITGLTDPICLGEKLICLKNEWDIISNKGNPLVNGTIGYIKHLEFDKAYFKGFYNYLPPLDIVRVDLETETGDIYHNLTFDQKEIITGVPTISDPKLIYQINKYYNSKTSIINNYINPLPISGTYGYAITCHKAQGSQWQKVLVIEENFPFDKEEHKKWIYTAATRPSDRLVMIKK